MGSTANGCDSICKVFVVLLAIIPFFFKPHFIDGNQCSVLWVSKPAYMSRVSASCVCLWKLSDVDSKVEVMQTFKLQDES